MNDKKKPDFLSIIEGCGSIHDQVAQLNKWYDQQQRIDMSDKKEWRKTYMSLDFTHGCESCGEDFVNSVIEKSCPVCGKETVVLFNQKYIDSIKEQYEAEKQRADQLEKENQNQKSIIIMAKDILKDFANSRYSGDYTEYRSKEILKEIEQIEDALK